MKKRVFFDMDGTLAVWQPTKQLEDLYQPGYFAGLKPQPMVVEAARKLILEHGEEVEVFILSAVLEDSPYAISDKDRWLDVNLPEMDREHRIYAPGAAPKFKCVPGGIRPSDILLDDYTANLLSWSDSAQGIKLLNGINHSRGTWKGPKVHKDAGTDQIVEAILELAKTPSSVVKLVRSGLANGLVRLITDPNMERGTVCSIGELWFYFGGLTAEEMSPEEYRKNIPIEDISREIVETLEDFANDESFAEEYSYYIGILKGGFGDGGNSANPML